MFRTAKAAQCLYFALAASFCASANAEMIYKSAQRIVQGAGSQLVNKLASSDATELAFTDDLLNSGYIRDTENKIVGSVSSSASQTSTLTGDQIRGLGRGSGFGSGSLGNDASAGSGLSSMLVTFEVAESMRFTLSGELRLAPHGKGLGLNDSQAFVRLTGPDGVALEATMDETHLPNNLGQIDFSGSSRLSGVFPAGEYTLEAIAEGHGSNGLLRCVDFDFTLTALEAVGVPEPSGMLMLTSIGLAIGVVRRRRIVGSENGRRC